MCRQLEKGINHSLNIFDLCKPYDCPNIHPAILLFQGNSRQPVIINSIFDHSAFLQRTSHLNLGSHCICKKAGHPKCPLIDDIGQHIKKGNPLFLKGRNHPFGTNDFFLPFSCIDSMFCKKNIFFVYIASQAGQKTAISSTYGMIHICFRYLTSHKIQDRQQHGTHSMKGICKSYVRIFLPANFYKKIQKSLTFQKSHRI